MIQDSLFPVPKPPKKAKPKPRPEDALEPLPEAEPRPCKWCGAWILVGTTHTGKVTAIDLDTHINHWITCAKRDEARAHYQKARRKQ